MSDAIVERERPNGRAPVIGGQGRVKGHVQGFQRLVSGIAARLQIRRSEALLHIFVNGSYYV